MSLYAPEVSLVTEMCNNNLLVLGVSAKENLSPQTQLTGHCQVTHPANSVDCTQWSLLTLDSTFIGSEIDIVETLDGIKCYPVSGVRDVHITNKFREDSVCANRLVELFRPAITSVQVHDVDGVHYQTISKGLTFDQLLLESVLLEIEETSAETVHSKHTELYGTFNEMK